MALSFVHTSDWHLGHVYRNLGPRARESARWRFEAVRRVFDLAVEKRADFIVVAGDVFETDTPSQATMKAAAELLRAAPAPTYLIAGHHDPCAEGSVWFHPDFQAALQNAPNIFLARDCEALQVNDGDGVLFPCPVHERHSREDLTSWIPDAPRRSTSQARIGLAHGSLDEIDAQLCERCGLDYLALGGDHGFSSPDSSDDQTRARYSGAPEVGDRDDARAGHALLVEIEEAGAPPRVTPYSVGRVCLHDWGAVSLQPGDGLDGLQTRLNAIENKSDALVRAQIEGCVSPGEWRELEAWQSKLRDWVLAAEIDFSRLLTEPTRDDFRALELEAPEEHLLEMLQAPLDSTQLMGISEREIVTAWSRDEAARREARVLFYQLLRGEV